MGSARTRKQIKYMYLRVFWFGHFPRSRIKSKSIFFLIKCYIITVLKKWTISSQTIAFQKMDIPLYFQKVFFFGGGEFFPLNFLLKKPPEYAKFSLVTCPKLIAVTAWMDVLVNGRYVACMDDIVFGCYSVLMTRCIDDTVYWWHVVLMTRCIDDMVNGWHG